MSRTTFAVGMRPVKATLLSLPVDIDGMLRVWREQIGDATGLPLRTIDRHLARAVDAGWLIHHEHGGHGRQARYEVSVPAEVARHKWQATGPNCAPRSTRNSGVVARHLVAKSEGKSTSRGEHGAVDEGRQHDAPPANACVFATVTQLQRRSDERATAHIAPVVDLRSADALGEAS